MSQRVKSARPYASSRRAAQARQTQREILDAAHRLLVDLGYAAATIELMAKEAGVAVQTIYSSVGNKRAVLWAVLETRVTGDDAPRTVVDRIRGELEGVAGARDRLARAVRFCRQTLARSADVRRIMESAAATEPEVASALDEAEHRRGRDAVAIVRLIAGDDGLGRGVDARTAADLWFAITSYEVYGLLTGRRRWSSTRYERWVARALEPILVDGA